MAWLPLLSKGVLMPKFSTFSPIFFTRKIEVSFVILLHSNDYREVKHVDASIYLILLHFDL